MKADDRLVLRVFEIIKYFDCQWFIENPATGLLKTRDVVRGLKWFDIDYCISGGTPYRKRTRVWTNVEFQQPRLCKQDCWACEGTGRHKEWAQKAAKERGGVGYKTRELGRIPRLVCEEIYSMALGLKT